MTIYQIKRSATDKTAPLPENIVEAALFQPYND
jgi:hypothetical protein